MTAIFSPITESRVMPLVKADFGVAIVHLFQNDIEPDKNAGVVQFEEANFGGYIGDDTMTMLGPVIDEAGRWKLMTPAKTFIMTMTSPQNTIFGYYVTFADDSGLFIAERFVTPVGMTQFASITIQPEIVFQGWTGSAEPIS